jgi:hypothetical protein
MKKLLVTILGLLIALALALALFLSVSTPWSRDKAITIKPKDTKSQNITTQNIHTDSVFLYIPGSGESNQRQARTQEAKWIADHTNTETIVIDRGNWPYQIEENLSNPMARLIGTTKIPTTQEIAKLIQSNLNKGKITKIFCHSAGCFETYAALNQLKPNQSQIQTIIIYFVASPLPESSLEELKANGYKLFSILDPYDDIACSSISKTGPEEWLYALNLVEDNLKNCQKKYSLKESIKAHDLANYNLKFMEIYSAQTFLETL